MEFGIVIRIRLINIKSPNKIPRIIYYVISVISRRVIRIMYQLSIGNLDILLLVYDTWEVKKKFKISFI